MAALHGPTRLHEQLLFGVRCGQRIEVRPLRCERRIESVDRPDIDDRCASPLIDPDRRVNEVGAAQRELPNEVWRYIGVAGFGEIAVARSPNESCVAREIEPAERFGGRRDLNWSLRLLRLGVASRTTPASSAMTSAIPPILKSAVAIASVAAISAIATVRPISAIGAISPVCPLAAVTE
jgi:hypothetical protein